MMVGPTEFPPWLPRALRAVVIGAALLVFGGLGLSRAFGVRDVAWATPGRGKPRIVSLAPSLTTTLIALGLVDEIVGVSDHCTAPSIGGRPRVGSWLTPNYEGIARVDPTWIVTLADPGAAPDKLRAIAPTETLSWLTVVDMEASIKKLGRITARTERAEALAARVDSVLGHPVAPGPDRRPRVLMVIGDAQMRLSEVWFIRGASIHGAVLEAAGGRNAVAEPLQGPPRMSFTELVALDPDAIVVLARGSDRADVVDRYRRQWSSLDALAAVRNGRIAVIAGPDVQAVGPEVLDLVPRVRAALRGLFGAQ